MFVAAESFMNQMGKGFTTFDRDNDGKGNGNCATIMQAGWWFKNCATMLGTGPYGNSTTTCGADNACNFWEGFGPLAATNLKTFEMKIRPMPVTG
jgi:hypothetical protein